MAMMQTPFTRGRDARRRLLTLFVGATLLLLATRSSPTSTFVPVPDATARAALRTAQSGLLGLALAAGMQPSLPSLAEDVTILDGKASIFTEPYSPFLFVNKIQEPEVLSAQKKWGEGIVEIGKLAGKPAEYTAKAQSVIDSLYGYKTGPVLFKPTKAAAKPFRLDTKAALSYFVSGNPEFPEDKGFALKPWTAVRFENNGVLLEGTTALAQGNYFFTDTDGKETKVEYTFGYFRDSEGALRINLHHSSLPFKPE